MSGFRTDIIDISLFRNVLEIKYESITEVRKLLINRLMGSLDYSWKQVAI
jgi:hypothetical protein